LGWFERGKVFRKQGDSNVLMNGNFKNVDNSKQE
jgi:hypothetical protein